MGEEMEVLTESQQLNSAPESTVEHYCEGEWHAFSATVLPSSSSSVDGLHLASGSANGVSLLEDQPTKIRRHSMSSEVSAPVGSPPTAVAGRKAGRRSLMAHITSSGW